MLLQLLTSRLHTLVVVSLKRLMARQVRRLGRGMEPFRNNAFYLLLWRAILAGLIGLVSMATCRLGPAAAALIGANVALLFSLGLIASLQWSAGERIVWTKA